MAPLLRPPAAAVYLNVKVFPAEPAPAELGETAIEPEPSAAAFANVAVRFCAELPMLNLQVPSPAGSVQAVMPPDWAVQPAKVELAAGVAVRLPLSLFPVEAEQLLEHDLLTLASVSSLIVTEP